MVRIAIIIGSTRPGRVGEQVGKWVLEQSKGRQDATFELIDLKDQNLPLLDEAILPGYGQYVNETTKAWAKKIASFDGFVFVTGEYNHGVPGALKNAIDVIYGEWVNKAAGFVSYGSASGVRSVEHLRTIMGELQIADVRAQVMLSLFTDFIDSTEFKPDPRHDAEAQTLFDQVIAWSQAMRTVRVKA